MEHIISTQLIQKLSYNDASRLYVLKIQQLWICPSKFDDFFRIQGSYVHLQ